MEDLDVEEQKNIIINALDNKEIIFRPSFAEPLEGEPRKANAQIIGFKPCKE